MPILVTRPAAEVVPMFSTHTTTAILLSG